MHYFVDEDLDGPAFVDPLRTAGIVLTRHRDLFAQGTPDTTWLPHVARLGHVVLTSDTRMRFTPLEVAAINTSNARVLFVRKRANATHPMLAELVIRSHEVVAEYFARCKIGCVAVLTRRSPSEDPNDSKPGRLVFPAIFGHRR